MSDRLGIAPADVADMPREALPGLLAGLAALQAAVAARLAVVPDANGNGAGPDEMLTAEQAARRTGMSRRLLYKQTKAGKLPFARRVSEKALRFSALGIERWLAARKIGAGTVR